MGAADVELAAKPAPITASAASVTVFMTYLLMQVRMDRALLNVPLPPRNVANGPVVPPGFLPHRAGTNINDHGCLRV